MTGSTPNKSHACSKAKSSLPHSEGGRPIHSMLASNGFQAQSIPSQHFRRYKPSFYLISSNLFSSVILLLNSAPCPKAIPLLHFLHLLFSSQTSVLPCLHIHHLVFPYEPCSVYRPIIVIMIIDLNPVIHTPSIWLGLLCSFIDSERMLSFQPWVDLYTNMDACSYDLVSLHTIWT